MQKEYRVIETESLKDLERAVNTYLRQGYSLWGGVCVNVLPRVTMFYQAVVKEVK
jgi:hypothetical protein